MIRSDVVGSLLRPGKVRIYGVSSSRASRRLWTLEEIGAPYESVPVDPHDREYLAIDPNASVPALVALGVTRDRPVSRAPLPVRSARRLLERVMKALCAAATIALLALGAAAAARAGDEPVHRVTREEQTVRVAGVAETWRLEWQGEPEETCSPEDTVGWFTCPCSGFEFGEAGALDLVRLRGGKEIERLPLTPLFGKRGEAVLRRWPVLKSDVGDSSQADGDDKLTAAFAERVRARKRVRILELVDANHDGWKTEFLLRVDSVGCGGLMTVAVGVTRDRPHVHVLGTAEHPDRPLVMEERDWRRLIAATHELRSLSRDCDYDGGWQHTEFVLSTDARGIHATKETYHCLDDGGQGPTEREVE